MLSIPFTEEKYYTLAKEQGPQAALTKLHQDFVSWEFLAFEGPKGYQPQIIKDLKVPRDFSQKLWDIGTTK